MKEQLEAILAKVQHLANLVRPDTAEDREVRETLVLLNQALEAAGAATAPAPTPAPAAPAETEGMQAVLDSLQQIRAKVDDLAHVVMAPSTAPAEAAPAPEPAAAPAEAAA